MGSDGPLVFYFGDVTDMIGVSCLRKPRSVSPWWILLLLTSQVVSASLYSWIRGGGGSDFMSETKKTVIALRFSETEVKSTDMEVHGLSPQRSQVCSGAT